MVQDFLDRPYILYNIHTICLHLSISHMFIYLYILILQDALQMHPDDFEEKYKVLEFY